MSAARTDYLTKCPEMGLLETAMTFGMKRPGIHHIDATANWMSQVSVGCRLVFLQGALRE
jgi:hypothetical protein